MSDEAQRAALARLLLEVQRQPGLHALAARQPAALFDGMRQVLQWAAGRQLDVMASTLARTEADLQHAAMWLVRQTCLRPGADALTVLGLAPGFTRASLREHYRLLIRLMHPDFMAAHQGETPWPDDAAQRINTANDTLLRRLGDAEEDPGEPEPVAPPAPVAPAAPAYAHPQPAPAGYPRAKPATTDPGWSWDSISPRAKMAGAATGALLCAVALVWGNSGSGGSRLVARPPAKSVPTPQSALNVSDVAHPVTTVPSPAVQPEELVQVASVAAGNTPTVQVHPATTQAAKTAAEVSAADVASPPATVGSSTAVAAAPAEQVARWWESTVALPKSPPAEALVTTPPTTEAPPPPPTRLGMADVQTLMTNLMGHLGHGRVQEAVTMVAAGQGGSGDFARRYREWLGSHSVQGMGVVTMEAKPRNGQLWVDGTVELRVTTADGQADRRFLPFRAAFEGEPQQAVLVSLSLRPAQP